MPRLRLEITPRPTNEIREVAIEACRQWANVRVMVLPSMTTHPAATEASQAEIEKFDKQMFRLGEKVWTNPT